MDSKYRCERKPHDSEMRGQRSKLDTHWSSRGFSKLIDRAIVFITNHYFAWIVQDAIASNKLFGRGRALPIEQPLTKAVFLKVWGLTIHLPGKIAGHRLLLQFAEKRLAKAPSTLAIEDLNAPFLGAFLDDMESTRANGARSRNLRLTAIRSFFRFAALEAPQHSGLIQRVLVIPNRRHARPLVGFLTRPEIDALLAVPDPETSLGRPDHTLLLTAIQTGLRLSEITSIRQPDVILTTGAHIRCEGKGRKERCTPLTKPH